jgi:hypothetical protein
MTHVSDEQKIGNLHSDEPRRQRQTRLWASRTPADMSYLQMRVHLHDFRKSLNERPGG